VISRAGRTAAAVTAAVVTTAGSHVLGTGAAPSLAAVLVAVAALAVPAWWLTGHERGWERLAGAQLAAQFGGHALFVALPADPGASAGHGSLAPDLVLGVHVLGAAVAGAWLRHGERRAAVAARRAVLALRRLLSGLLPVLRTAGPAAPAPAVHGPADRIRAARLRHSIVHRGPPAGCH
jgi:hypothetical protein